MLWTKYTFQIVTMDQERLWLGLPLAMVPQETLPSKKTVLRAFYGIFGNERTNINSAKVCCPLQKDNNKARCEVEEGCRTLSPCLLYQVIKTTKTT